MLINGVDVTIRNVPHISKDEVIAYIALITNEHGGIKPRSLTISTNEAEQHDRVKHGL